MGSTTATVVCAGALVAGCQSAPAQYAGTGFHATYSAASTGAGAVRATGVELYHGAGSAFRAPLHDLNMMQDQIPPVLLRAENRPYDLAGVNSCGDVLDRVSQLDLALGPDVDTPKQRKRTRAARGADFAASAALDAAGSAAEHFIPMRSTLKQISGAARYERHAQHAVLVGQTRRSFLKAVGMAHGCSWPAAPLDYRPPQVADIAAPWVAPAAGAVRVASAAGAPVAASAAGGSTLHITALVADASASPAMSHLVLVPASPVRRPALRVAVSGRLDIPPALPSSEPDQTWRPAAARRPELVQVSSPVATSASGAGAPAMAPWSSAFAGTGGAALARP